MLAHSFILVNLLAIKVTLRKKTHIIIFTGDESIGFLLKSPGIKFFKFRDKYVTFYQQVFFQESFTNYLVFNLCIMSHFHSLLSTFIYTEDLGHATLKWRVQFSCLYLTSWLFIYDSANNGMQPWCCGDGEINCRSNWMVGLSKTRLGVAIKEAVTVLETLGLIQ